MPASAVPSSPLGHVEPKDWNDVLAVNLTANWQLIRTMDPLLRRAPAGRVVFLTSGSAHNARAYRGPYSMSKSGLETLARTYANETATTNVRINVFSPNPTRTKMRAAIMPGEDPMTLPTPEEVAAAIVPLCLSSCTESGKFYDFRQSKFLDFHPPS